MKVWGVYDDELKEIAAEVGLSLRGKGAKREGRAYRFRLALAEPLPYGGFRFQKRDQYGGYGTSHVCWHGQREFLYALFRRFPEAVVDTTFDRYYGAAQFHARYKQTRKMKARGYVNNEGRCTCPIRPRRRVRTRRVSLQDPTIQVQSTTAAGWTTTLQDAAASLDELRRQFNIPTEDSTS